MCILELQYGRLVNIWMRIRPRFTPDLQMQPHNKLCFANCKLLRIFIFVRFCAFLYNFKLNFAISIKGLTAFAPNGCFPQATS